MKNSSIGIIGGADGPQTIILSGDPVLTLVLGVAIAILLTVTIALLIKKKRARQQ